ncbi:MAG TPA: chemotaxis protein CheW [Burkholderiaceae bacterium]
MSDDTSYRALVFRISGRLYSLPLAQVVETMRPLPVQRFHGAPDFVLGAAIVRGQPVPVISAARLLGEAAVACRRWITIATGVRRVALEVDDVLGVRSIPAADDAMRQPLLEGAGLDRVATLGRLDGQLLRSLQGACLVPEDAWAAMGAEEAAA